MDWFEEPDNKKLKIVKECRLHRNEENILHQLIQLLFPLKEATLIFSTSRAPQLTDVVVTLQRLSLNYQKIITDYKNNSLLVDGANRVLKVINKYSTLIYQNHPLYLAALCEFL